MPTALTRKNTEQLTKYADRFSAIGTEARLRIVELLLTVHPEGLVVAKFRKSMEDVEFLKGEIENIPLPDNSVDVMISNCVMNVPLPRTRCCGSVSPAQAGRSLCRLGCGDAR